MSRLEHKSYTHQQSYKPDHLAGPLTKRVSSQTGDRKAEWAIATVSVGSFSVSVSSLQGERKVCCGSGTLRGVWILPDCVQRHTSKRFPELVASDLSAPHLALLANGEPAFQLRFQSDHALVKLIGGVVTVTVLFSHFLRCLVLKILMAGLFPSPPLSWQHIWILTSKFRNLQIRSKLTLSL